MPVLSMFYGIIVRMFYFDTAKHKSPHVHIQCGGQTAVVRIPDGKTLSGKIHPAKKKLVLAWMEIHREDLMADWKLAVEGQSVFKIEPLR